MTKIKNIFLFFILCASIAVADDFNIPADPLDHCYDESGGQQGWVQKTSHRLGVQSLDKGNTGMTFPFLLPELPEEHEVTAVSFSIYIEDTSNFFETSAVMAAMYGTRTDKKPAVLSSDTVTAYAEGTLIGDKLFPLDKKLWKGKQTLTLSTEYIQSLYKARKVGEYVFLTLLPNATMDQENRFAVVASGNHPSPEWQPTLHLTTAKKKPFETSIKPGYVSEEERGSWTPSLILLGVGAFLLMCLKKVEPEDE